MKAYKILMALAFAGMMTSCLDEKATYEPGAPSAGVYFPTTNADVVKVTKDDSQFVVKVMRTDESQAATCNVAVTYPEDATYQDIFSIPATVNFAAGQKTADMIVTFDKTKIDFDFKYKMTFSVSSDEATEYGLSDYSFYVYKELTWSPMGLALYTDDFITTFFGVDNVTYKVPIESCDQVEGKYRLVNPYGAAYPYNEPGDYASGDHYMVFDCTVPDRTYVDLFESGMNWGYGEFRMWSRSQLLLANGYTSDEIYDAGWYGTLEDGVVTFPEKGLLISMADYNDGGWYVANGNGAFRLVFPGYYVDKDYASAISYNGLFLNADDDKYYAVTTVTVGSDATLAQAAIIATQDPEEVYTAILNQTADVKAINPGKSQTIYFPIKGAGTYTIGLVTFDGEEIVEKNDVTFEVVLGSQPEQGAWEDLGDGVFVDGWMLPGFTDNNDNPINPFDWAYYVKVQKDTENPGVYRIFSPYMGDVPLGNMNENKKDAYLVFDCSDPDFVMFPTQYSGLSIKGLFSGGVDQVYVGDAGYMFLENYDKEEIIDAGYNGTFSDGIIELPVGYFGPSIEECSYYWTDMDHYPIVVELPDASMKAKFNSMWNRSLNRVRASFAKKIKGTSGRPSIIKTTAKMCNGHVL